MGVEIKPSKSKNKKIDVYKNNNKIASVGAIGYNDYPTYIKEKGLEYANKRGLFNGLYHFLQISSFYEADIMPLNAQLDYEILRLTIKRI
eukprot:gene16034-21762_t